MLVRKIDSKLKLFTSIRFDVLIAYTIWKKRIIQKIYAREKLWMIWSNPYKAFVKFEENFTLIFSKDKMKIDDELIRYKVRCNIVSDQFFEYFLFDK